MKKRINGNAVIARRHTAIIGLACAAALLSFRARANDVTDTANDGTSGDDGTMGWIPEQNLQDNGGAGTPGSPGDAATANASSSDASNSATATGGNGGHGGSGGWGWHYGGQGADAGAGGSATATAMGSGSVDSASSVNASATGGTGGTGGAGGNGAGTGLSGGNGAAGANASATATGAPLVFGIAAATATAIGGIGGNGGAYGTGDHNFPGSPQPIGSGNDGLSAAGGNAFASASATNATADPVTVTATAQAGNGGNSGWLYQELQPLDAAVAIGNDAWGGAGGSASLGSVTGSSSGGGDVTVTANLIGGSGGYGFLGLAGASESLTNGVSGSTAGNLTLVQNVFAGSGGLSGDAGIFGYSGGAAGNASSCVKLIQNGAASLNVMCFAVAGDAGNMSNSAGGNGIAKADITGDSNVNATAGAAGGNGASYYPNYSGNDAFVPPLRGGAGGSATATAIANSTGTAQGRSRASASATANDVLINNSYYGSTNGGAPHLADAGPGLVGSGPGNPGGAASATATATNAGPDAVTANASSLAGSGGNAQGDGFGAAAGADASSTATGISTGGGTITASATAQAGNGGAAFDGAAPGNGGNATATATVNSAAGTVISAVAVANGGSAGAINGFPAALGGTATATAAANGVTVTQTDARTDALSPDSANAAVYWGSSSSPPGTAFVQIDGDAPQISSKQVTVVGSPAFINGIVGLGSLTLGDGHTPTILHLEENTGCSFQQTLTINPTATLDIANNSFIERSGNPQNIRSLIQSGYNLGDWMGQGVTSADATSISADPMQLHKTAVGYALASALGLSEFQGQTVDSDSVIISYTFSGDANLDGTVNALDFNALATNYGNTPGSDVWTQGDFNYDGTVDSSDFDTLAANYGQVMPSAATVADQPALGAIVPEPIGLSLLIAGNLLCRRRSVK